MERFQHVCLDLVGKLPILEGYQYLFTVVDRFTKFVHAIPLKDALADSVCSAFLHGWVAYMGVLSFCNPIMEAVFFHKSFKLFYEC